MRYRCRLLPRLRAGILAVVFTVTAVGLDTLPVTPPAVPQGTPASAPLPFGLGPDPVLAAYCSTPNPSFTGKLTQTLQNSGTPPTISRITNGNVYGWISRVDAAWTCTLYRRYSALAWNTSSTTGTFDWGTIINSTSVGCNWLVGTTDYLKANGTTACSSSDTDDAMAITLSPQGVYQADSAHNGVGDFSFAHVDCDTSPYYGAEVVKTGASFSASSTTNRPGANCDAMSLDSTGTTQTVTYDATAPVLNFDTPDELATLATVSGASYTVQFDATDAVAGFGGSNGWSLQRQIAPWPGAACGTFANDPAADALVTGSTNAANQTSAQTLAGGSCYRWTLDALDQNGNTASTATSGSVRRDTSALLGEEPYWRFESWDLGGGDSLAVNVATGNLVLAHPIVTLPIRGSALSLSLHYNSQDTADVDVGPGGLLFGSLGAATEVGKYAITTPQDDWRGDDARDVAVGGFVEYGSYGIVVPGAGAAAKILTKVPGATRVAARLGTLATKTSQFATSTRGRLPVWRGGEVRFSSNFRIKPLPTLERPIPKALPHYHRRGPIDLRTGGTEKGQGIGRYRPWQTSPTDGRFWDRF